MRLIDADKLYPDRMTNKGVAISQSQIADAPTIEIRPTGKWVDDTEGLNYYANCSVCGLQIDVHENHGYHNYCPNCGARMEVEK